ncbi:MAG: imidazole glycerol phosphate synthase subunit HisH [Nitriliruptoraceae bacterium]
MTDPVRRVAVLDYGAGNVRSARRGFEAAGADVTITASPTVAADADVLVIPGVGHFASCVANLRDAGLHRLLETWIADDRPLFGICVGMQLLYATSEEGDEPGLGLLPGRVVRLPAGAQVPHLGWNVVVDTRDDPLFAGIDRERFYFTHSYYAVPDDQDHVVARCTHGSVDFPCVVREGNVVGTQFHPEKSGAIGNQLLANWLRSLDTSP